jgi:hypothetical protein
MENLPSELSKKRVHTLGRCKRFKNLADFGFLKAWNGLYYSSFTDVSITLRVEATTHGILSHSAPQSDPVREETVAVHIRPSVRDQDLLWVALSAANSRLEWGSSSWVSLQSRPNLKNEMV